MENDLTPAAEAEDAQPAASEESASVEIPSTPSEDALMNALIRGETAPLDSASNLDDDGPGMSDADAASGEPAPRGDAKPNDQQTGRRSKHAAEAAERLSALESENAALQSRIAELAPPPPDATEETRKAILANEDRYRRLTNKPDDDTDWTPDDYQWLQDEKRKRAALPELRQHYETVVEQDRRTLRETADRERQEFWTRVSEDLASAAELPGVDLDALKKAPNFATRDRLVYAAAAATRDAEIRTLRDENAQLQRDLLGTIRPPMNGGRSSPGRTYDEDSVMNALIRGGRA